MKRMPEIGRRKPGRFRKDRQEWKGIKRPERDRNRLEK